MAIQKTPTQVLNDSMAKNQILETVPDNWDKIQPYLSSGEVNPSFLGLTPIQKLAHYYSRFADTPFYGRSPLDALAFAEGVKQQALSPKIQREITAYDQLDLDNNDILKEWGVTPQNLRGTPNYAMPAYASHTPVDRVITRASAPKPIENTTSQPASGTGYIADADRVVTTETPASTATTTPTDTTDTDIVTKTPVYDRPAYTKAGSLLSLDELAKAIIDNKFGKGAARKQALADAGYSVDQIDAAQKLVNKTMAKPVRRAPVRKTIDAVIASSLPDAATAYQRGPYAPVVPNTSSGYAVGHEAYYDPQRGLMFR